VNNLRRASLAALFVACLHLVFGAIVRISGSGMGCGDHWPKCYGHWFPPLSRPDLIVEVSHRYLASILVIAVSTMVLVAWRHRAEPGVGGRRGALRSAFGALGAVFTAAILGGVTVKLGTAPYATLAHWLVAMALIALVATTAVRAGALGGSAASTERGTTRAARAAIAAAAMALLAVAMGGLTAKYPGAAVGCTTFPLCGRNPEVTLSATYVQLAHRTIAILLVLHLAGATAMLRRRGSQEASVVIRAATVALALALLQIVVAAAMVLGHLPPVLRSLHEAIGVGIWLACFVFAYLSAIGGRGSAVGINGNSESSLRIGRRSSIPDRRSPIPDPR
jgi:heme A synthase